MLGGAGGVGAYAVQLAAQHGARVTATASARNQAFVTGLGAGDVLDYTSRFEDHVHDVDVIIDPVGGSTTARSWPLLRSGGILVAIAVQEADPAAAGRDDVAACTLSSSPTEASFASWPRSSTASSCGRWSRLLELSALPEAFQAQRSARPPGKVIITVSQPAG